MKFKIFPGITLHFGSKDGGPESRVYMYGLECKAVCSVLVLRFEDGSREAYHSHAFEARSVVLGPGILRETERLPHGLGSVRRLYAPGWRVIRTARECMHRVVSLGRTWVISVRGPWVPSWSEYIPATGTVVNLQHGRVTT